MNSRIKRLKETRDEIINKYAEEVAELVIELVDDFAREVELQIKRLPTESAIKEACEVWVDDIHSKFAKL